MEGFPQINVNAFEKDASKLISGIPNFNEMPYGEKVIALKKLIDTLADRSVPNFDFRKNIGIAKELGRIFFITEEKDRNSARMAELGVTV